MPVDACKRLRERALELVDAFDAESVRSVFSVTKQTQLNDDYFNDSGDKIRFFFEDGAFDESGSLLQAKEHSLNKMGHAMHDLDPVFDEFSRTPELAAVVERYSDSEHQPGGNDAVGQPSGRRRLRLGPGSDRGRGRGKRRDGHAQLPGGL